MLHRPQTIADLQPPFLVIGEPQWDTRLRALLVAYDVPLVDPIAPETVTHRERELRITFPPSLRRFLETFGPLDFDGLQIVPPTAIGPLDQLWFKDHLPLDDQQRLPALYGIAETGADDVYAWHVPTQRCCCVGHDPGGVWGWLASFDDLIRSAVIDLSWSRYGWPGDDMEDLAQAAKQAFVTAVAEPGRS